MKQPGLAGEVPPLQNHRCPQAPGGTGCPGPTSPVSRNHFLSMEPLRSQRDLSSPAGHRGLCVPLPPGSPVPLEQSSRNTEPPEPPGAQLANGPGLDMGSGQDVTGPGIEPRVGLQARHGVCPLGLPLRSPLSQVSKSLKNLKKKYKACPEGPPAVAPSFLSRTKSMCPSGHDAPMG